MSGLPQPFPGSSVQPVRNTPPDYQIAQPPLGGGFPGSNAAIQQPHPQGQPPQFAPDAARSQGHDGSRGRGRADLSRGRVRGRGRGRWQRGKFQCYLLHGCTILEGIVQLGLLAAITFTEGISPMMLLQGLVLHALSRMLKYGS